MKRFSLTSISPTCKRLGSLLIMLVLCMGMGRAVAPSQEGPRNLAVSLSSFFLLWRKCRQHAEAARILSFAQPARLPCLSRVSRTACCRFLTGHQFSPEPTYPTIKGIPRQSRSSCAISVNCMVSEVLVAVLCLVFVGFAIVLGVAGARSGKKHSMAEAGDTDKS